MSSSSYQTPNKKLPPRNNASCGDVTFLMQAQRRVYALNCCFCNQISLQWDSFIDHMEQDHDEDLDFDQKGFSESLKKVEQHSASKVKSKKSMKPVYVYEEDENNADLHSDPLTDGSNYAECSKFEGAIELMDQYEGTSIIIETQDPSYDDEQMRDGSKNVEPPGQKTIDGDTTINISGDDNYENIDLEKRKLIEMLICYYKSRPQLWNTSHSDYGNQKKAYEAYNYITNQINEQMNTHYKWINIRSEIDKLKSAFHKEHELQSTCRNIKREIDADDTSQIPVKPSWVYEQLNFLKDCIEDQTQHDPPTRHDARSNYPNYQNNDVLELLEEMNRKIHYLTVKFDVFQSDVKQQNSIVIRALGKNNVAIDNIVKTNAPKYTKIFPLKSLEEFNKLEESINETNENEYVASIRAIVGKRGVKKGLADLIAPEVLVHFNVEGIHNKMRLLNYEKFINVLCMGTYDMNEFSQKTFKEELKYAVKLVKNRFFKEKVKTRESSAATLASLANTLDDSMSFPQ
ncbi:uncharacterized protein LOC142228400 [Haematobia irritans]|uniref:uncharacterized protein LOC142228400 n=1 Tax=Haematobia irritans TaxID=7368 RepID=UPI003F501751